MMFSYLLNFGFVDVPNYEVDRFILMFGIPPGIFIFEEVFFAALPITDAFLADEFSLLVSY
jgi:hypothetical protein